MRTEEDLPRIEADDTATSSPSPTDSEGCPRCKSPQPHLHPAVQHEGEVAICHDPFHYSAMPSLCNLSYAEIVAAGGRLDLVVGDIVTLGQEDFTVRAVTSTGRYAICTRPFGAPDIRRIAEFEEEHPDEEQPSGSPSEDSQVVYTVIDFERGVNGRDNYGGLGYDTDEDVASSLAMFESGEAEVSHRTANWVHLDIRGVREADTGSRP